VYFVHSGKSSQRACNTPGIPENSGLLWADFYAHGKQSLNQAMIAEGAFICDPGLRVQVTGAVRTGLDAVSTTDAALGVNQDHPVVGFKGSPNRANLNARRMIALVAYLGNKKTAEHILLDKGISVFVSLHIDGIDGNSPIGLDHISFHPGSKVEGGGRNIVFCFASLHAPATPNTFVYIYTHPVIMFRGIVVFVENGCPSISGETAHNSPR